MYGDGISKREYLRRSRDEILGLFGTKFMCIGKTKAGNPVHPLYKSGESRFLEFDGGFGEKLDKKRKV